jgi:hypothetical protein
MNVRKLLRFAAVCRFQAASMWSPYPDARASAVSNHHGTAPIYPSSDLGADNCDFFVEG